MPSHYTFDWKIFVTPDLVTQVAAAAQYSGDPAAFSDCVTPLLSALFKRMGGKAVADREYNLAEQTAIAQKLLHEAVLRALSRLRVRSIPGVYLQEGQAGQPATARAFERVDLNSASAAQIETLPAIGPGLAQRIVVERRKRPFTSPNDLARRVNGIGPEIVDRLIPTVTFLPARARLQVAVSHNLSEDVRLLVNLQSQALPIDKAAAALELALISAASTRYPLAPVLLDKPLPADSPALAADEITTLAGSQYYNRLQTLFAGAQQAIEVCMFHIAFPTPTHPVRRLLDGLIAARQRGLIVRVLVDQDRENDPYLSTVINASAVKFLKDNGVAVRTDPADKLLHSKFVLIDTDQALIGSHNWSAGSFFVFDDLTLLIRSQAVTAAQRQRFDTLWAAGV